MQKTFGAIFIIIGVGFFTYGILSFSNFRGDYYFYTSNKLLIISGGAMLITTGILMIKSYKKS